MTETKKDPQHKFFKTQAEFEAWLSENFDKEDGVWLQIYKKDSGKTSITRGEALDVVLCYGWIDAIVHGLDEESFEQKYTPRRNKSLWSKINRENIARLTAAGKMKPPGILQVEQAKADGRWDAAYDSPKNAVAPKEFLDELAKYPKAEAFYKTLNKTNTYAIIWRIQIAKTAATKQKRIDEAIAMLSEGKTYH